jgi:hypothetical protein
MIQCSNGQVDTLDVMTIPDQPGLRRTQAERLVPELIGGN